MSTPTASCNAESNAKSKKPSDSAFKQQRLKAWQPILTAGTVLPTFFVIGIIFIPVGIVLLHSSNKVSEFSIDYTDCNSTSHAGTKCSEQLNLTVTSPPCICEIDIPLVHDFEGDVYIYYGLTNFYQNHRRYVKSRDDRQLLGNLDVPPSRDCVPFQFNASELESNRKPIAPCGAIANSLFNDNLTILDEHGKSVPVLKKGIAWQSDKDIKFKNPPGDLKTAFQNFTKPLRWTKNVWELDPDDPTNNGFQNEDLIVWMRTAALPTFRKLYRILDRQQEGYETGLRKGNYKLRVEYNYQVTPFEGTKRIIISTTSQLGGKNPFLGIAYIVVGCICLLLGIVFLFIHIKCGKSTADVINVNPRTPYQ